MISSAVIIKLAAQWHTDGHPHGQFGVVRPNRRRDGVRKVSAGDSAYNDYIEWVMSGGFNDDDRNLYLPEIKKYYRDGDAVLIEMEALEPLPVTDGWCVSSSCSSGRWTCGSMWDEEELANVLYYMADGALYSNYNAALPEWITEDAWDVMQEIAQMAGFYGHRADIHPGNLMMRSNGDLVVTDPWFNPSGLRLYDAVRDYGYSY